MSCEDKNFVLLLRTVPGHLIVLKVVVQGEQAVGQIVKI